MERIDEIIQMCGVSLCLIATKIIQMPFAISSVLSQINDSTIIKTLTFIVLYTSPRNTSHTHRK